MTPGEVKGLQAIALRHGGSLTVNPDTGLPEAGFLEQILPIVAAAGLTYLTAGAAAPTLTAALGGSTLAGGIAAGALSGAAISGGMAAVQGKDAGKAALMGGIGGALSGGMGAYDAANVFNAPNLLADASQQVATNAGTTAGAEISKQALGSAAAPQSFDYNLASGEMIPAGTGAAPVGVGATSIPSTVPPTVPGAPIPGSTIPGLNTGDVEAQLGGFYGGAAPANPYANASDAQIQAAIKTQAPSSSYYAGLGPDNYVQKAGIQALPVLGLLEDEQQSAPQDNYQSPLRRISPDFKAYEPPRPDPYYRARYAAEGGIMQSYQSGGPVERMSMANTAMNPQGGLYPQGMIDKTQYATPIQRPVSAELMMDAPAYERSSPMLMNTGGTARLPKGDPGLYRDADPTTRGQDAFTAALTRLNSMQKKANIKGLPALKAAAQPLGNIQEAAKGGVMSSLGGYSDGGRMLKGPGDGMSDSIPASIANKQPARLADGEFVVPADVVSHLGNGSTDAGARKLYAMMDKIRKARTGKKKQAPAVKADRYMPA
jgi:hypothetical protein